MVTSVADSRESKESDGHPTHRTKINKQKRPRYIRSKLLARQNISSVQLDVVLQPEVFCCCSAQEGGWYISGCQRRKVSELTRMVCSGECSSW